MVYLLVDKIEQNGMVGMVYNFDKFIHNLQRFGATYYEQFQQKLMTSSEDFFLDIMPCGRFICTIQQTKQKTKSGMVFMDAKNDFQFALQLSTSFLKYPNGKEYQKLFLITFKEMESDYQKLYKEVELSLDASFLS